MRISPDPRAWLRKYFIEASISWLAEEEDRRGIKDRRFNSSPIQIISQLVDEIEMIEPRIRVDEKRTEYGNKGI